MAKFLVTRNDNKTVEVIAYGIQNIANYGTTVSAQPLSFYDYVRPFRFTNTPQQNAPAGILAAPTAQPYVDEFGDYYDDYNPAPAVAGGMQDYPTIWVCAVFAAGEWKSVVRVPEEE